MDGIKLLTPRNKRRRVYANATLLLATLGIPLAASEQSGLPMAAFGFLLFGYVSRAKSIVALISIMAGAGYLAQWATGLILAPVLVLAFVVADTAGRRSILAFPRRDRLRIWIVAISIGGASAATLWVVWLSPLLATVWLRPGLLPEALIHPPALLVASVGFLALANAIFEEALWRGAVNHGLMAAGIGRITALCIGSAAFGVAHLHGAPPGLLGVALASVFAFSMSLLTAWSQSLVPGIVAHAIVDIAILAPLAT